MCNGSVRGGDLSFPASTLLGLSLKTQDVEKTHPKWELKVFKFCATSVSSYKVSITVLHFCLIIIIIYFIRSQIPLVLLFQNTLQSELNSQKDLRKALGFSRGDL